MRWCIQTRSIDPELLVGYYIWKGDPVIGAVETCCPLLCRCTHCKSVAYCSAMCAQAHIFDHECDEAPKPWLSPPVGPNAKPPDELGEEGFMGAIPWPVVKYAVLIGLTWACIFGWRRFDDFRYGCTCVCCVLFCC